MREFTTTEKDMEKGVSRIPLNLSRLFEEDLLDDKGEYLHPEQCQHKLKKLGPLVGVGAGQSYIDEMRGGTVVGEILHTEELELFEEIIDHRISAYNNSSGIKNNSNSYGEDKATDDEEDINGSMKKEKLAPLFKRATQTDANFEDFKIINMIGKGTFGKVYLIKN